jgi:hypothetical protein
MQMCVKSLIFLIGDATSLFEQYDILRERERENNLMCSEKKPDVSACLSLVHPPN